MSFAAVFAALFIAHHVGDYLLQTEWQAVHKRGGLGRDPVARRALLTHVTTYTVAFVPVLVWIASEGDAALATGLGVLVFVPHLVVDDGRALRSYMRTVKGVTEPMEAKLVTAVDQSFHFVSLFAVALLAEAAT